ncbi:MAG: YraN family protein [bacterium]|nr:YraN family protein [bacterium]
MLKNLKPRPARKPIQPLLPKSPKIKLGHQAEAWFSNYLIKQLKHQILCRNFRFKIGEIDVVSLHQKIVYFWEVKARTSLNYGYPEDSINQAKIKRLQKGVDIFFQQFPAYQACDRHIYVASLIIADSKIIDLSLFQLM